MDMQLRNVRLAFTQSLFRAQAVQGGAPSHNIKCLIDPKTQKKLIAEIEAAMDEVAEAKWGTKAEKIMATLKKEQRLCLRDGDDKPDWDGFEGMMYLSASNKTKPLIIDRDRTVLGETDGKPYAGCYANVTINLWAQDSKDYGKRINAQLRGVQFVKDGDAFAGGGVASANEFDDLSDTGDDDDDVA